MPTDALRELLEACLLTDGEMEARREGWMELEDRFPGWILGDAEGKGVDEALPVHHH